MMQTDESETFVSSSSCTSEMKKRIFGYFVSNIFRDLPVLLRGSENLASRSGIAITEESKAAALRNRLTQVIADINYVEDISPALGRVAVEKYYGPETIWDMPETDKRKDLIRLYLYSFLVYLKMSMQRAERGETNFEAVKEVTPEGLLHRFREVIRVAVMFVPFTKGLFLEIGGRLEGQATYSKYVTGGGAGNDITCREKIIEEEVAKASQILLVSRSLPDLSVRCSFEKTRPLVRIDLAEYLVGISPDEHPFFTKEAYYVTFINNARIKVAHDDTIDQKFRPMINETKKYFPDVWFFDELLILPLRDLIEEVEKCINQEKSLGGKSINEVKILRKYCVQKNCCDSDSFWLTMRTILIVCLLLKFHESSPSTQSTASAAAVDATKKIAEFLAYYRNIAPDDDFAHDGIDDREAQLLMKFHNWVLFANRHIRGTSRKVIMMSVCSRLEGAGNDYGRGGSATTVTKRREFIFSHITGEGKRTRRSKGDAAVASTSANFTGANPSVKKKRSRKRLASSLNEKDSASLSVSKVPRYSQPQEYSPCQESQDSIVTSGCWTCVAGDGNTETGLQTLSGNNDSAGQEGNSPMDCDDSPNCSLPMDLSAFDHSGCILLTSETLEYTFDNTRVQPSHTDPIIPLTDTDLSQSIDLPQREESLLDLTESARALSHSTVNGQVPVFTNSDHAFVDAAESDHEVSENFDDCLCSELDDERLDFLAGMKSVESTSPRVDIVAHHQSRKIC